MSFFKFCSVSVSLVALAACAPHEGSSQKNAEQHEWVIKTQQDLKEAHAIMLENHPGPKDIENPEFNMQADKALSRAMEISEKVTDKAGYGASLLAYMAEFRDGHFAVFPSEDGRDEVIDEWPGMIPAWRSGKVTIAHTEPELSELQGAELIGCDGTAAEQLIRDHIFGFYHGKLNQESYWARQAPHLFLYSGNPMTPKLKRCEFRLANGELIEKDLNWLAAEDKFWQYRYKATFGKRPDTALREYRPGHFWISLPDFSPDEADIKAMRDIFNVIKTRQNELRNAQSITIDVRGNEGGSSGWGHEMIEALWGKDYPNQRRPPDETYVEWRLSEGNVAHMEFVVNYLTENKQEDMAKSFQTVFDGAKLAHEQGLVFYREGDDNLEVTKPDDDLIENPVKAPVYFLTHGYCASACLDFADALFELEDITHIGYPTSSDTNYMEVRFQDLSSGLGKIVIPTKVYRNRTRESGAFYEPKHKYDELDWSDIAFEDWVQSIVQAE